MSMIYKRFGSFIEKAQYGYTADETSTEKGDAKYLRITDIVPYFVDKEKVPFCSINDEKKQQYLVKENDLLIARTGATTGYNLIVPKGFDNYIFASYLVRYYYDQTKLYPLYLKHVLKSRQYYGFINNYIGGSAQPGMNPRAFSKFEVPYVEYETQKRIASILSAYDNLIEVNNNRIKILEQMAENLYKEWFVRFRFPGYENAEFENGIPKGWEKTRIKDFCSFDNGFAFKSEEYCESGEYIVITIKNVQDGKFALNSIERIEHIPDTMPDCCNLEKGDILISLTGNVGRVCIVTENKCLLNQRVSRLVSKYPYYTYEFFRQDAIYQALCNIAYGTAQLNLSPVLAGRMKVFMPPDFLQQAYNDLVSPLFERIQILVDENKNLTKQRDLLLPRLMSGKLEV